MFDSSGESRHIEGGRPSGTSTPNQSDGEGVGGETVTERISPIRQLKGYKRTPSVKRKLETHLHTLRHQQLVNTLKEGREGGCGGRSQHCVGEFWGGGGALANIAVTQNKSTATHRTQETTRASVYSSQHTATLTAAGHCPCSSCQHHRYTRTQIEHGVGREGGEWQTVKRKQTRTHGRETNGQTHTGSTLQHTHVSTDHYSQHTQPAQINTTCRSHNSGVRPDGMGGGGPLPRRQSS